MSVTKFDQEWDVRQRLKRIEAKLDAQNVLLTEVYVAVTGKNVPDDLQIILLKQGEHDMAAKIKCKLNPKSGKLGMVMQPVTLTSTTAGIELVVVDASGTPLSPPPDPTKVTTTLTSDDTSKFTITAGADGLHFTGTVAANATGTVNLAATLTYNDGSFGPFQASIQLTLPTPPVPTPKDLEIIIS